MAERLRAELVGSGASADRIVYRRSADMRYVGQGFEVNTPLAASLLEAGSGGVAACFHDAYERQYGHRLADQSIEALNWRLEASARVNWPAIAWAYRSVPRARSSVAPTSTFYRRWTLRRDDGPQRGRPRQEGAWCEGPALIEQAGSTVVVGPGDRCAMDREGHIRLILERSGV